MHRHPASTTQAARASGRPGFTLVELLAVILIIGLIAALLTPVIMQSLAKARNAAIKSEIDMLHMAIMNYKNEYGSFPPAVDTTLSSTSDAGKHVLRIFPRCTAASINAQLLGGFPTSASPTTINTVNAVSYWLLGYTSNPTSPLSPNSSRKKLFDFDQSRVDAVSGAYHPSGKPSSPYLYLNSALYTTYPYDVVNTPSAFGALRQSYAGDASPFTNVGAETNAFFNPDTFQILCAGRDETFGTDDDLSNFWPGTRKEYLESLGN